MPDYQNGKIYKIVDNTTNDIYIGSTTKNTLAERMSQHRKEYKLWLEGAKRHISSFTLFDKYGIKNCKIYLIESVPCNTKDELTSREGYYIKTIPCVNKRIEGRTRKEYIEDNKNVIKLHTKQYYKENIQKIKNYRDEHKEATKEYNEKYKNENRDALKIKNKEYYEKKREDILRKKREQIFECECGVICKHCVKAQHFKSLKHKKYIEQKEK